MVNQMCFQLVFLIACFGPAAISARAQERVSTDSATDRLRYSGAILPSERADIGYRKEGAIADVLAKPGDSVEAGQIIATIDARELELRCALAEQEMRKATAVQADSSAITSARAQLAKVEATLNANLKLQQKSDLEFFRLRMDRNEKQAAFDLANAKHHQDGIDLAIKTEQFNLSQNDLDNAMIRSPIDGIISEQLHYKGESIRPGEVILKMVHMNDLLFRVELDIAKMPPHRLADYRASIRFESSDGEFVQLEGVAFERTIPNNLDSQYYFAMVSIKNQQVTDRNGKRHWRLRPGMAGQVVFQEVPSRDH
jgi:HlyD family secretion protein